MTVFVSLLLFPVTVPNPAHSQSPPPTEPYVYVLVWSGSLNPQNPSLLTYKQDLENDGFSVEIKTPQQFGTTSENIRQFLKNEATTHNITGILLVGDIPYARYEMEYENYTYIFPCDLYYMDLDGNWTDSDGNEIYDMHTNETGNLEPEIWVGRLWASTMTGDEEDLLINYFDKNHRFRNGELTLPRRSLAYIDDDFVDSNADEINSSLRMIYGNETTLVTDPQTTTATHYKNTLNDTLGYEWLHLVSHGGDDSHCFKIGPMQWTYVFSSEIRFIDPHAFFYNIMACRTADYSQTDYIGGSYIFADTYGLLAVSSTKPGQMTSCNDFYGPIAEGRCIGQAFKEWFEKHGELDRFFYYGLTILGDPTLRTPRICDVAVTDVTPSKTVVVQNSTIPINVTLKNKGVFTEIFNVTAHYDENPIGTQRSITLARGNSTIITFTWDTTGIAKGRYAISATAVLPMDNHPDDNTHTESWVLVVLEDDVAVTNITPLKAVVGQGFTLPINVTIQNIGNHDENFNVTAYANTIIIATFTNIALKSGNSTVITFTWNTTGFPYGNYTISATATPVPGETDTTDNARACWVLVMITGDVNGDGECNILDVKRVKQVYSGYISPPDPDWYRAVALAEPDDAVNILDVKKIKLIYSVIL